jgi:inner membrane protein involved in colicin E2 resistance
MEYLKFFEEHQGFAFCFAVAVIMVISTTGSWLAAIVREWRKK